MTQFPVQPDWLMWATVMVVISAVYLYAAERLAMEVVSVGVLIALLMLFGLFGADSASMTEKLLSGFGNPALITIMSLLVVGQGIFQTGAIDSLSRRLTDFYDRAPRMTLVGAFLVVFVISAFINNTPVVVMFLPLMTVIAGRMGVAPSRVLIPLSFVALLAGTTTLIGTSTNLLAADALMRLEGVQLGFFDLTPIGLVLAAAGLTYLAFVGPLLLPDRQGDGSLASLADGRHFIAQIEVDAHHPLVGATPVAGRFEELPDITVRMVQRGKTSVLPPFSDLTIHAGDLVILAATRKALTDLFTRRPKFLRLILQAVSQDRGKDTTGPLSLSEAVVAPGSRLISRAVDQTGYDRDGHIAILGVQRRSRMIRSRLGSIRLEAGDTLLLCAKPEALDQLRPDRDLLLLDWSRSSLPDIHKASVARIIALGVVLASMSGYVSVLMASLTGALCMVASSCLNVRQAGRALDLKIFLLVGSAISMGVALEATGVAGLIASLAVDAARPFGPAAIASMLFLVSAVVTNVVSNTATAVIFAPIAIASARQLGLDPLLFLLAVIYGANCAFATPIAYQTNLLVMAPGHYRFSDYLRIGAPMIVILWLVFSSVAFWRLNLAHRSPHPWHPDPRTHYLEQGQP